MLKEFKQYLQLKKLSKVSVKNYLSDIRQFLTWTAKNSFKVLKPAVFNAYKSHFLSQKTPIKTINRHLSSLRCFGRFLKQEKLMMVNPAQGLKNINIKINADKSPALAIKAGNLHLKKFEQMLIREKLKPATIKNYLSDVGQFLKWLELRS